MKRNTDVLVSLFVLFCLTSFVDKPENKSALPAYEVRFTFIGYIDLYGGAGSCHMNDTGKVILNGILEGPENRGPDNPVLYTGKLQLSIHIDICATKRVDGEDKFCTMNVNGSGVVNTELEGHYIRIKHNPGLGKFQKSVNGGCEAAEMIEEQNMIPNESIAAIFNGLELPMLAHTLGQLQLNKEYSYKMENGIVAIKVLRKIR
jgi:hypothetical protein